MKEGVLKPYIARGVYQVEDEHRGKTMKQIIFTRRPWWSKVGAELFALPGGKIEAKDFLPLVTVGLMTQAQYDDPEFVPTEDLVIRAAEATVKREFFEELGPEAAGLVAVGLMYLGMSKTWDEVNQINWISLVYGKNGGEKMNLSTTGNDDGTVWESSYHLRENNTSDLAFLSGQKKMAAEAIEKLDVI